jgi:hypothetical protein
MSADSKLQEGIKMKNTRKTLKERSAELGNRLPIMEGRKKGALDDIINKQVTIRDYGFLPGESGDYAVFILDEDAKAFYFAGKVLTADLQELDKDEYHDAVVAEGLPIVLTEKKNKKNQPYTSVEYK